jgi:hypothetical protein
LVAALAQGQRSPVIVRPFVHLALKVLLGLSKLVPRREDS